MILGIVIPIPIIMICLCVYFTKGIWCCLKNEEVSNELAKPIGQDWFIAGESQIGVGHSDRGGGGSGNNDRTATSPAGVTKIPNTAYHRAESKDSAEV